MVYYVKQGEVPESRHTYIDRSRIYKEELFGEEGFDGPYSLLYHLGEPTRVKKVTKVMKEPINEKSTDELLHRHFSTSFFKPSGDLVSGRRPVLFNDDVRMGTVKPGKPMENYFRHALRDQLLFVPGVKGTNFNTGEIPEQVRPAQGRHAILYQGHKGTCAGGTFQ